MTLVFAVYIASLGAKSYAQGAETYGQLIQKGNELLQAGDGKTALGYAQRALQQAPARWEGYALEGGAFNNLQRYEDAANATGKAIAHAPADKQEALRELRRQYLAATGATPIPNPKSVAAAADTPAGPSFSDTVKWIQSRIGNAGFPGESYRHKEMITTYDDAKYSVHFNGCSMQLSLVGHMHITDTEPLNPHDQTDFDTKMSIVFKLPLEKLWDPQPEMLAAQDWARPVVRDDYASKLIPAVVISLPWDGVGSFSYNYSSNQGGDPPHNIVMVDKPVGADGFHIESQRLNGAGGRIGYTGFLMSYARPATEDEPEHMAAALRHLIELCKHDPNQGTKDLF